jgi:WD40 repeat protein
VAAGFSDGVIRLLTHSYIDSDTLQANVGLELAIKPHTSGVSTIAFSPNGNFMATGSQDHTVFLFKLKCDVTTHNGDPGVNFNHKSVSFTPLGFITMDSIIQTISFSPDNHRNVDELEKNERFSRQYVDYSKLDTGSNFLILLKNGHVYRGTVSYDGKYDTSLTFELNKADLNIQKWIPSIKIAPTPIALENSKSGEAENDGKENEGKDIAVEMKLEDMTEDQRESVTRRKHGLCLTADANFTNIMYLEGGYLLASLINSDGEGEVRVFKLENPEVSRLLLVHRAPFSQIRFSRSMRYLLAGSNDGVLFVKEISVAHMILNKWSEGHETYESYSNQIKLEIQNARLANDLQYGIAEGDKKAIRTPSQFWMGYSHDCLDSKVTAFQSSFDDAYFISSGEDGSLFVWRCSELEPRKNLSNYFMLFTNISS